MKLQKNRPFVYAVKNVGKAENILSSECQY